ncbi:tyrosine-protein phosphatase [Staphylococcus equorum]|uniref:tyrosine-protein phosphatase n=1 Tax=Staphylococcus equorum TaxID=246432 RepID=UPI002DB79329|nr:CpsB/CapC family capsule biosynthesis tyrosine phosphatase [Staphylococcus equorum]MEB7847913.1 capsular biosynthesis protein [Staphylococcus equorum]
MIDLHNHLLIDVDDGPQTNQDAIELVKQAKEEGVSEIVVTPHHLHTRYNNPIQKVKEKIQELQAIVEFQESNVRLYHGQEIRITDQMVQDIKNGDIVGINDSRYLLIELPTNEVPHYTKNLFYELQTMGYTPIIAHPERNKAISQNLDLLHDLINGGALSQLTSSSLSGNFGKNTKKISIQMIENNLTHFIASDAHNHINRPFLMKSLINDKKLKNFQNEINTLMGNAKSVIQDGKISKQIPTQNYNQKKWFGLL